MNKVKVLTWSVVVLLILNITTIATVFFHMRNTSADEQVIVVDAENSNRLTGRFFRQELNFDNDQMQAFRDANHLFQFKVRNIVFKLDSLKTENFTELNQINSDSLRLEEIALEIGLQHKELKMITNEFYLELKKLTNNQQFVLMKNAFSPLFSTDTFNRGPMKGGRNRRNMRNESVISNQ